MRMYIPVLATVLAWVQLTVSIPCDNEQLSIKSHGGVQIQTVADKVENSYIIKVKDDVNKKETMYWVKNHLDRDSKIVHDYDPEFYNAFSGFFSRDVINLLRDRDDIEYIREDALADLARNELITAPMTQYTCPWGLHRISHSGLARPPFSFSYETPAGAGADIYIIDTGIYVDHADFGGRARWGWAAPGLSQYDGNGHGTHCAAIAGGAVYGVAKNANLIAVKAISKSTLHDEGQGAVSNIIAGIQWALEQSRFTLRPSVVSMSIRVKPADIALDSAVQSAINEGLHFVAAAGNDGGEASGVSPARVQDCTTVGAMDIRDVRMTSSNHGNTVDMWAPGVNVLSAWIGHPWASAIQSGTSTSAPHVAGIAAYLLAKEGKMSTEDLRILLRENREKLKSGDSVARL
ncbi:subtilisin-like serine protease [Tulasnella sp. 330]|nr:subtilisin-like serine protease [Tulasnella sp. 330]KAG8885017.1 subtilisin-like serine protease [Tulasnella sp. 331]KAG8890910.1 subtilisin-like serine protease [Tulasnella sp. 332]